MTTHLLDANVLIALTVADHEQYERVSVWASHVATFAVCPVVERALIRFLHRVGECVAVAPHLFAAVHARPYAAVS